MPPVTIEQPEELVALLRQLLEEWESSPRDFTSRRDLAPDRVLIVFGLAAHAHTMAASFLKQYEDQEYMQALPAARVTFEHALTAQWVAQYPDAADGFYNESVRQRRNLAKTGAKLGWKTAIEVADELEKAGKLPSSANDSAGNIEKICGDLEPAGDSAYAMYRLLCSYTHASARTVDAYLRADPMEAFTYPQGFDTSDCLLWLFLTCASLVWAARAFDMLEGTHPRMKELRKVAKQLGVPLQFQLSAAAKSREQQYRRQKWKGPAKQSQRA